MPLVSILFLVFVGPGGGASHISGPRHQLLSHEVVDTEHSHKKPQGLGLKWAGRGTASTAPTLGEWGSLQSRAEGGRWGQQNQLQALREDQALGPQRAPGAYEAAGNAGSLRPWPHQA